MTCQSSSTIVALIAFLIVGCERSPYDGPSAVHRAIVRQVVEGKIPVDKYGLGTLPASLEDATTDHRVYVAHGPDGTVLITYPLWRGKARNFVGLVYCSMAVPDVVINNNSIGPWVDRENDRYAGPVEVQVDRRFEAHWYQVSFQLD
jgi:hypothetical protein